MNASTTSLVLELVDDATFCIALEVLFELDDAVKLREHLSLQNDLSGMAIELDATTLNKIRQAFPQHSIPESFNCGFVTAQHALDQLPYTLHTNRELLLMLDNKKPLAVFVQEPGDEITTKLVAKFEPYVEAGRFIKVVADFPAGVGIQRICFATPQEAWRIKAYDLLWKTAAITGWNDGFERLEGSLLGYTDEQNDLYLKHQQQMSARATK